MKIDMSPEAVTNRLKTMEQLWELSVNLMQAQEISKNALSSEKSLAKDRNAPLEIKGRSHLTNVPPIK